MAKKKTVESKLMFDPALGSVLSVLAEQLFDIEKVAIAQANRMQYVTTRKEAMRDVWDEELGCMVPTATGKMWGLGLDPDDPKNESIMPALLALRETAQGLEDLTRQATVALEEAMSLHPISVWIGKQRSLGLKQVGRLLGVFEGDVLWHTIEQRPRTVMELWSYSGWKVNDDGTVPRRQKGERALWSPEAKMRSYLIAAQCVKGLVGPCERLNGDVSAKHVDGCQCSPYRIVYDIARAKYEFATHDHPCPRCGQKGSPAPVGSLLSKPHQNARAHRYTAKRILRDLHRETARLYRSGQMGLHFAH